MNYMYYEGTVLCVAHGVAVIRKMDWITVLQRPIIIDVAPLYQHVKRPFFVQPRPNETLEVFSRQ